MAQLSPHLVSIFTLREKILAISRRNNYQQLSSSQVVFDLLFNAMHTLLASLKFYHIKKNDQTEVLAFDSDSSIAIIDYLQKIDDHQSVSKCLVVDSSIVIPSSSYQMISGEAETFDDVSSFRKRWADIYKINKRIFRTRGVDEEKNSRTHSLKMAKCLPTECRIFVALDFETFEHDHSQLTEIGVSLYHSIRGDYSGVHILLKETIHLRNGRYVADNKDRYEFGSSIILSMSEARDCLWDWLSDATAVIGHGVQEEKRLLKSLLISSQFEKLSSQAELFDTQVMFKSAYPSCTKSNLSYILDTLGIEYWHLHNAGNDARYTLMAFLKLHHHLVYNTQPM